MQSSKFTQHGYETCSRSIFFLFFSLQSRKAVSKRCKNKSSILIVLINLTIELSLSLSD